MKNYIILIRKADFADLYKYGYLYINKERVVSFDCSIEKLSDRENLFNKLFEFTNPFDYTFAYLLVHYRKDELSNRLNIEDVQHVFALDEEAQKELSISLDEKINIENPIWPKFIQNLKIKMDIEASKNGAENIWKILKIKDNLDKYYKVIGDPIIKEIYNELYLGKRPSGDLSIWVYLLRYERHSFYPSETIGYFFDAIHVFVNFLSKKENDSIDDMEIAVFSFLKRLNKKLAYNEIINAIKNSEECRGFIKKMGDVTSICYIEVAPLFFILKRLFIEGFDLHKDKANDYLKHSSKFGESYYWAIYLLGIVLGYDKTYDCLYEQLHLPIFKPLTSTKTEINNKDVFASNNNRGKAQTQKEELKKQSEVTRNNNDNKVDTFEEQLNQNIKSPDESINCQKPYLFKHRNNGYIRTTISVDVMINITRVQAEQKLKQVFNIEHFYDEQWNTINELLQGKRILLIERTGFGKSLCYQFPAILFDGITVIFSPLIALMRDQVQNLVRKGIPAQCINSEQTSEENEQAINDAILGKIKILYIAPERQENQEWIEATRRMNLSMVVIDEAHTISVWGHDFRPAFRRIVNLVNLLPKDMPVLATTATATLRVQNDIEQQIGGELKTIRGNLVRENFNLYVGSTER